MRVHLNDDENPKIVVMNIDPQNIENCIKDTIHGAKINTASAGNVEKLNRGDICLIRRTSGGGRYEYGVVGIWYFVRSEDVEGIQQPQWIPPDIWKYKIIMQPLIKEFELPFFEDFSKEVEGQLRHKESSKVEGLKQTDIQGAVRIGFRDPELRNRYLKAIIEEKKKELDIDAEYLDSLGIKSEINVYEYLTSLIGITDTESKKKEKSLSALEQEKKSEETLPEDKTLKDMELDDFIENFIEKINKLKEINANEANTKSNLIEPLLKYLNWDIHNIDEVEKEKSVLSGNFVDYALKINGKSIMYVEAKKVRDNLNIKKTISNAIRYAVDDGIKWLLITNGDKLHLYKVLEPGDLTKKLVLGINISNKKNLKLLKYFDKDYINKGILSNELDKLLIKKKVQKTIKTLLVQIPDDFVEYLQLKLPNLTQEQINNALKQIKLKKKVE